MASEAIADYLRRTADAVTIDGAGPVFVDGGPTAFLLLHGWGASAESLRFLAHGLAEDGYSVLVPTLPGHGTSADDMLRTGPLDWIAAARDALALLGRQFERAHLLGVSMGGALALQLAAIEPDVVAGLVTVNAPVSLRRPQFACDLMSGPADEMLPAWQGPGFVGPPVAEITYPERSRKSGIDLITMTALAREALPLITAPLLIVQSTRDHVVPGSNAGDIFDGAGSASKRIEWLHNSYHMSQLDLDRNHIVRLAADFARSLTVTEH